MHDTNINRKMLYDNKAVNFGPPAAFVIPVKFFKFLLTAQCANSDKLHSAATAPSNMNKTPWT